MNKSSTFNHYSQRRILKPCAINAPLAGKPVFYGKMMRGALLVSAASLLAFGASACSSSKSAEKTATTPIEKTETSAPSAKPAAPAPSVSKPKSKSPAKKNAKANPKSGAVWAKPKVSAPANSPSALSYSSSPADKPNPIEYPDAHANVEKELKAATVPHNWSGGKLDAARSRDVVYSNGTVTIIDNRFGEIIASYDISGFVGKPSAADIAIVAKDARKGRANYNFTVLYKGAPMFEHSRIITGHALYFINGGRKVKVPRIK